MFVFAPPAQPVVPVAGEKNVYFPIRRVFGVGLNYVGHAKEGEKPEIRKPCLFSKNPDAVCPIDAGKTARVPFPQHTENLQHEVELVVAVGKGGRDLTPDLAAQCIWGWAVGVDLTRRDLQQRAKKQGDPWTTAKDFDYSGPISHLVRKERVLDPKNSELWLYVNNECRQKGSTCNMIWSVSQILSEISTYWELQPGDLVFTGSPSGGTTLQRGDIVRAGCNGIGMIEFELV